jgi:predicted nucleotidyltransferase/DNA-binding transcriptional ArsR family regulator
LFSALSTIVSCLRTLILVIENDSAIVLAVGRSVVRRRILALLMAGPEQRLHLRAIQRRATTSPGTASRELGRLVAAGLVEREAEGHQVYFRTTPSPFATMIQTLLGAPAASVPTGRPVALPPARPGTDGEFRQLTLFAAAPVPIRPSRAIRAVSPVQLDPKRPDGLGLQVAGRLADLLRPLYGDRLVGIFLYGSRARGESRPDSDVEVFIVLENIESYGNELELTSATCASLSLEFGLVVSRVFVSRDAWRGWADGQPLAVRSEAVAV